MWDYYVGNPDPGVEHCIEPSTYQKKNWNEIISCKK